MKILQLFAILISMVRVFGPQHHPKHVPTLDERRKKQAQELRRIEQSVVRKAEIAQFGKTIGGPDTYEASGTETKGKNYNFVDILKYPTPGKVYTSSDQYENKVVLHLVQLKNGWRLVSWKSLQTHSKKRTQNKEVR